MDHKQIGEHPRRMAIVFESGDAVVSTLESIAEEKGLACSSFTAIGAFSRVALAFFDVDRKEYDEILVEEQVEVLSLVGNVTDLADGSKRIHAHVVVGLPDGTTRGGHLVEATVRPTLELFLSEGSGALVRVEDPETGLSLIEPQA